MTILKIVTNYSYFVVRFQNSICNETNHQLKENTNDIYKSGIVYSLWLRNQLLTQYLGHSIIRIVVDTYISIAYMSYSSYLGEDFEYRKHLWKKSNKSRVCHVKHIMWILLWHIVTLRLRCFDRHIAQQSAILMNLLQIYGNRICLSFTDRRFA